MAKISKKKDKQGLAAAVTTGVIASAVKRMGSRYVTKGKLKFTKRDALAVAGGAAVAWITYRFSKYSR